MNTFFDPVNNTAAVEQLNKELGKDGGRTVLISGCIDTQKVHISSAIASGYKYMLIVTSDEAKARKMCDDASFFNKEAIYYPAKDAIFYSADVHGNQITGERLRCISRITTIAVRARECLQLLQLWTELQTGSYLSKDLRRQL